MSLSKKQTQLIWFLLPFIAVLTFLIIRENLSTPRPGEVVETGPGFVGSYQEQRLKYDFSFGFDHIEQALTSLLAAQGFSPSEYARISREATYSQPLSAKAASANWFRPEISTVVTWPYKELTIITPSTDDELLIFDYQRMLEASLARFGAEVLTEELLDIQPAKLKWDKLSELLAAEPEIKRIVGLKLTLGYQARVNGEEITVVTHDVTLVQPWSEVYAHRYADRVKPKVAIVLDDWGYDYPEVVQTMFNLPVKLNMAVIPGLTKAAEQALLGFTNGWEVMLHLPMEPQNPGWRLGEYGVLTEMTEDQIRETVRKALAVVPAIAGVNNHMGSKATADQRVMQIVLEELAERGLFFVDSHTTGASVVPQVAATVDDILIAENQVFLDNENNIDYILQRLELLVEVALRQGQALGIGHLRPSTAQALERFFQSEASQYVEIVFASELVSSQN